MEKPASFGATIRDRRLARGYSLGQLATKVNKTAASIRAWERDANEPDTAELAALAEALDLDTALLTSLLVAGAAVQPQVAQAEVVEPEDPSAADAVADPWSEGEPGADGEPERELVDEAAADPVPTDDVIEDAPGVAEAMAAGAPIHEAMTEAVPVVAAGSVAVADSAAPGDAEVEGVRPRPFTFGAGENPILQTWDAMLDWYRRVFDPERKWIYRVRIVLLIIALFVMLRVLGWALGHLWDAVQEVLDSISFSPTETPDVAN